MVDVILKKSKEVIENVEEKEKELNILQKKLNLDNLEKIVKKDFSKILKKYGIQNLEELENKLNNSKKILNIFNILYKD
jgi:NADH:ubiquinone oxidoreductase subunit C